MAQTAMWTATYRVRESRLNDTEESVVGAEWHQEAIGALADMCCGRSQNAVGPPGACVNRLRSSGCSTRTRDPTIRVLMSWCSHSRCPEATSPPFHSARQAFRYSS